MKKLNLNLISYILLLSSILLASKMCQTKQNSNIVYVDYFKNGDTLFPDYACIDTLIVYDAIGLNKAIAFIEQDTTGEIGGDYYIDSTFHEYCKPIN